MNVFTQQWYIARVHVTSNEFRELKSKLKFGFCIQTLFKLTTLESLAKIFVKIDSFAKNKIEEKIIPKYYFLDIKTNEVYVKTGFKIVFDGGTDDGKTTFSTKKIIRRLKRTYCICRTDEDWAYER